MRSPSQTGRLLWLCLYFVVLNCTTSVLFVLPIWLHYFVCLCTLQLMFGCLAQAKNKRGKERVTLLNFFGVGSNKPVPLPTPCPKKKPKKKKPPKATRVRKLKVGRPSATNVAKDVKMNKFKQHIARTESPGSLATPAQKRRQWSGTVKYKKNFVYFLLQ